MSSKFAPNIDNRGRWIRGLGAVALLAGAVAALWVSLWLALVLFAAGVFVAFEAMRGWCLLRACGVKTRV